MGKLKIIKAGPLTTVQDRGRIGFRKYGIPMSGAMDSEMMTFVNENVGNQKDDPVVENALLGMKLEALAPTSVSCAGCITKVNGQRTAASVILLEPGDSIELGLPEGVYSYLAIGGLLTLEKVSGSYSTYLPGNFGGLEGRALRKGDILETEGSENVTERAHTSQSAPSAIRFLKGPEWEFLKENFTSKQFQIDPSSNRIGIRLAGSKITCELHEIVSSAVIPGTIQLPPNGHPIVLMNDCQTTGGYPRIGKVINEDLGKLAQVRPGKPVLFELV